MKHGDYDGNDDDDDDDEDGDDYDVEFKSSVIWCDNVLFSL